MHKTTKRQIQFADPVAKSRWLDAQATIDAQTPFVRSLGIRLAKSVDVNDARALAVAIHRFVRNAITYVHDPSIEEFADTETILRRGADDCDGKARAFVALCRAVKLDARIRPVFRDGKFVHVQGEVRFPGSSADPLAEPGGWLVSDPIVKGSELGQAPPDIAKVGGKWLLA